MTCIVHDRCGAQAKFPAAKGSIGHRGALPRRRCIWRATRRYSAPMTHPKPLMCGVELGGTKCECLVGTAPDDIRERITVRTERDAAATLHRIAGILRDWKMRHGTFSALGLACFGPLELRPDSPDFGRIGMTPKEGWRNVDVAGFFADRFADAVGMTTDVIAAALAEGRWGAGRGVTDRKSTRLNSRPSQKSDAV